MKSVAVLIQAPIAAAIVFCGGCASIMSGRHAEVAFDSYPQDAQVVVRDRRGQEVASVRTPGKVTLKRKERIILPARYTASIEAPGYRGEQVPIRSTVNPWIVGNVVFGGIAGLAIDNVTGAVWKPRDSSIYRQLAPVYSAHESPWLQATQQMPLAATPSPQPTAPPQMASIPSAAPASGKEVQPAAAGPSIGAN